MGQERVKFFQKEIDWMVTSRKRNWLDDYIKKKKLIGWLHQEDLVNTSIVIEQT